MPEFSQIKLGVMFSLPFLPNLLYAYVYLHILPHLKLQE